MPASALPPHNTADPVAVAIAQAMTTGKAVEVVAKETDTTTTYANPDGTLTTDVASGPVRVAGGSGFVPVDPTLVAAGGVVAPRAAEGGTQLSAGNAVGGAELASLNAAGGHLGFRWPTALPTPTLSGATATYHNVIAGGDLVVTATTTGFEVSVVLRQAPSVAPVFDLPLNLNGLSLSQSTAGALSLTAANGTAVASSPPPIMYSAAVGAHSGERSQTETVASSIQSTPGGEMLVLRPDYAFLANPATVYPVTIDPASNLTTDLGTYVTAAFPTANYDTNAEVKVGKYDTPANTVDRSFIRFNDSAIKNVQVTSATLNLYETWSWSCTASPMNVQGASALSAGATWNTQPSVSGPVYSATFYGGYSGCPNTAGWKAIDVTGLAQTWSSDGAASPEALALLAPDETNNNQWKRFSNANTTNAPYVAVTYNPSAAPSAPQNVAAAPGNGAATISWMAPSNLGQPPMTAYYIYNYLWNGSSWVYQSYNTCAYPCTSTLFTGLTNGATYAANVYGWSSTAGLGAPGYGPAYVPAGPPGAPTNAVATAGNASTTVRWSAPASNGGMALDYYLIDAVDLNNNNLQFLNTTCGTCTFGTISGLTNGHLYAVDVWAHNALAGYGPAATSNDIITGAVDPMAGAGQRPDFTQQSFNLTDRTTATVNLGTGNLEISSTDLVLPTVSGSLPLGRVFNSMSAAPGSSIWFSTNFGYAWRFNQAPDVRLVPAANGSVAYDSPSGNVVTFTAAGSSFTTPAGFDATLVKNGDGSYTLTYHATAEVQIFGADGNLVYDTDRNGNRLTFTYPDGRRVMTITGTAGSAPGNNATITYGGPGGRVSSISQTDGTNTRSVAYTYDPNGQTLQQVQDADGGITSYGYDANDNVTQITSPAPLAAVTKFTYDANHRVTSVDRVVPGSPDHVTSYDYTTPGKTKITDGDSHPATIYTINSAGQVTGSTDPIGAATATTYTSNAQVHTFQNGSTGMTTATFGANSGESATNRSRPNLSQISATFNNPNFPFLPDTTTDTMANATVLTYAGAGNLQQSSDALHNVTSYTYNTDGTVATSTEPSNQAGPGHPTVNSTIYGYNISTHQLTAITPPTGNSLKPEGFSYDGYGRVKTAASAAGMTTTFVYDNLDRITGETFSDNSPAISQSYDGDGNPYQLNDTTGTTTTVYDAANELVSKSAPSAGTLTYSYDPAGNLTATGGDGQANPTSYHYNKLDEVDQITEPNGNVDTFAYNADHQRTDTWDNTGSSVTYDSSGNHVVPPTSFAVHIHQTYDTSNQLTEIRTTRASSDANANRVADLQYSYVVPNPTSCPGETAGWVTAMRQTVTDLVAGQTTTYCYDPLGRLTQASTTGGPTYIYGYDADGNRTNDAAGTHTFNSADQSTDPGSSYDANGNITASATYPSITYNSLSQTTAVNPSTGGPSFTYAGASQNNRLSVGATSQINGLLGVQVDMTAGAGSYYLRDPQGTLISETTGSGEYYYAFDGQGSVAALFSPTGVERAAYTYDPYGSNPTATALSGTLPANPWRYDSGYLDTTGLYHFGARYYDPATGRWTQTDPVFGSHAGDRYLYAGDDPIGMADPSGRDWWNPTTWDVGSSWLNPLTWGQDSSGPSFDFSIYGCFFVCGQAGVIFDTTNPVPIPYLSYGAGAAVGAGANAQVGTSGVQPGWNNTLTCGGGPLSGTITQDNNGGITGGSFGGGANAGFGCWAGNQFNF